MRRLSVPLMVALGTVAVALAWPAPASPLAPAGGGGAGGPVRLADAWPAARTVSLPAALPDGSRYEPMAVINDTTSVGVVTSADGSVIRLVVRSGTAMREVRVLADALHPTIAAVVAVGDQLFWLETGEDAGGSQHTSVWRAGVSGGTPRRIAADSSEVVYFNSAYDLEVQEGQVRWAAVGTAGRGEIHSVPVEGGPVSVRKLDRVYTLTSWPWLTTSGNSDPGPATLLNAATGATKTVAGRPDEILTCTPAWCRVTRLTDQGLNLAFEIERPDGAQRRRIGNTALIPLNTDVALLDRFEVLASSAAASSNTVAQRLWLHDLTNDKEVLLADGATGSIGSRGGFLWWSTGDNEAEVWHLVDLRQLT